MPSKPLNPISSIFLEPLVLHGESLGLSKDAIIGGIWDEKSKWVSSEGWIQAASRLESLSEDPFACYHAGFYWVESILDNNARYYTDSNFIVGKTYTLEREYMEGGVLRLTMHYAPNMEPPRNGVLFNLGGLNAIARNSDPYGKAFIIESQCEALQPLPPGHPDVSYGPSDVFEIT